MYYLLDQLEQRVWKQSLADFGHCLLSTIDGLGSQWTVVRLTLMLLLCSLLWIVYFAWMTVLSSVQFSSVAQSCPTLWNPMSRSTPGLPVHHHLLEFTQTHIHRVGDAIQLCHPLLSPSPSAPNPSQHQSLFQWVNSLHEVAKVLEFQL